jgi:hypothetical protein
MCLPGLDTTNAKMRGQNFAPKGHSDLEVEWEGIMTTTS